VSLPSEALQGAYVTRLKSQITAVSNRVYDEVPQTVVYPFIQIGQIQTINDGVGCLDSHEVNVTIHTWSRPSSTQGAPQGSRQAKQLVNAIHSAFADWEPDLSASGWRVVSHEYRSSQDMVENDTRTYHGVIEYKLLIDPVE
jgi:hypothetical protein